MLDAEPVISVRVAPRRVRERFERAGQADVAEGVDRDLKTALGGGADVGSGNPVPNFTGWPR